jgi:ParB family chromosome partitioning protein
MSEERTRARSLGRGLSALLGEEPPEAAAAEEPRQTRTLPVEFLRPNRHQPRRRFDEGEIASLVDSIRANGILQPILVRRHPSEPGRFEIVAGERRWRAAQQAQLHEVPVIVRDLTDQAALEVALVENIQRQDLNAIDEAEGYRRLLDEFGHTQDGIATTVGKSRSHVANTLRLLALPEAVQKLVQDGALSAGHARALIGLDNAPALAQAIVKRGLSVREAERLAQKAKTPSARKAGPPPKDPDTAALEKELSDLLGLKVTIRFDGERGELAVRYKTLEQLDEVLKRLTGGTR